MANQNLETLLEMGDKHYLEGRYQAAIESYDRLLQINSTDIEALRRKAEACLALDDRESALRCIDQIVANQPDQSWVHIEKGDFLTWLGIYDAAIVSYDLALSLDAEEPAIWRKKGLALRNLHHLEDALNSYDRALESDADDWQTWSAKGDVLLDLNRFPEAFDAFQKAENSPDSSFQAPDWTIRGDSLRDGGKAAEAIRYYDRSIARDRKYIWAWRGKGLVFQTQLQHEDARRCFDQALEIDPKSATIWVDKGCAFFNQQNYSAATMCFDRAIEIEPTNHFALANKGVVFQNLARYEEAIELYDKAIEADDSQGFAWENKGFCLDQLSRLDEAIKCYDRAIELESESVWAWNNKGYAYVRQGKYGDALKFFEKAIEIDQTESLPWVNKANVLKKLGRIDDAVQSLTAGLGVASDRHDMLTSLGNLYGDDKFEDDKALKCFEQALNEKPNDTVTRLNIAEVLIRLGRYTDAKALAVAVSRDSEGTGWLRLAQYFVMVSSVLDGKCASAEFQNFVEYFRSLSEKAIAGSPAWNFAGLSNTINKSGLALETKFVLLALIDLQLGRIHASKLSFFEIPAAGMLPAQQSAKT